MADNRPNIVDPGSVLTSVVNGKKSRKHPGKQIAPSHPVTVPETTLSVHQRLARRLHILPHSIPASS